MPAEPLLSQLRTEREAPELTAKVTEPLLSAYLTESEAAEQLDVCERTLKRWRSLKEGPPVTRIGRRIMYRRATITQWLQKQEVTA